MSRLAIAASAGLCIAQALGCAPVRAGVSAPVPSSAQAPTVPTSWERMRDASWAAETPTYADLFADFPPAPPTAVYDIMAHVVVLPDGARLEAHSGLAERVDDPRFVALRMRGATPPALYDLAPRKGSFHGVAALRLLPLDGNVFGRTGLLAHTYMLHGRPESNGCVVFRDYAAFLGAFRDGRITRLRVVPSVDNDARFEIVRAATPAG